MAAIEYGINGYGEKTYPREALRWSTYICPYCNEELLFVVPQSSNTKAFFKHKPIPNRTPVQRMCPGYTGKNGYCRIEGEVDRIYITNGGIPLYLNNIRDDAYELRAVFPPLSEDTMEKFKEWNVKVEIKEQGVEKSIFAAYNLQTYKVKTETDWVKVSCQNMRGRIPEVSHKWEWGIRGINCNLDIFHSIYNGGSRVALHSNIIAGSEYLIIQERKNKLQISGIKFEYKGVLCLKNTFKIKEFYIYSMVIEQINEEVIAYIQKKGYQVINKSDEIIPMWPPAVIEGKELIYRRNDNNAFLYHNKRANQKAFILGNSFSKPLNEEQNILTTPTNNKTVMLSEYNFNVYAKEIRNILTQGRKNYYAIKEYVPKVMIKGEKSIFKQIGELDEQILHERKIILKSEDMDVVAYMIKRYQVIRSGKCQLENRIPYDKLIVDVGPFGMYELKALEKQEKNVLENKDIEQLILAMKTCRTGLVPINNDIFALLNLVKDVSTKLYSEIYKWVVQGRIPAGIVEYAEKIKLPVYFK